VVVEEAVAELAREKFFAQCGHAPAKANAEIAALPE
jgi:hypothetical protein